MWYPAEQEDEDIDCNEAEQFALPNSDTKHQSFVKTAQNTGEGEFSPPLPHTETTKGELSSLFFPISFQQFPSKILQDEYVLKLHKLTFQWLRLFWGREKKRKN